MVLQPCLRTFASVPAIQFCLSPPFHSSLSCLHHRHHLLSVLVHLPSQFPSSVSAIISSHCYHCSPALSLSVAVCCLLLPSLSTVTVCHHCCCPLFTVM